MNVYVLLSLAIVFLTTFVEYALATTCTRETFGMTQYFTCPGPVDLPTERYCCGTKKFRYCCDLSNYSDAIKSVGVIIGVIIVIIIALVVVVIVSCFCCSCCLLARRRQQRGQVLVGGGQTGGAAATAAQPMVPPTVTPYVQQPYPQQPYPQQPPAGYPVQPAPVGPTMPAPNFGYYPSPYGNPPPYTDNVMPVQQPPPMQQPPYNPSYPAKWVSERGCTVRRDVRHPEPRTGVERWFQGKWPALGLTTVRAMFWHCCIFVTWSWFTKEHAGRWFLLRYRVCRLSVVWLYLTSSGGSYAKVVTLCNWVLMHMEVQGENYGKNCRSSFCSL